MSRLITVILPLCFLGWAYAAPPEAPASSQASSAPPEARQHDAPASPADSTAQPTTSAAATDAAELQELAKLITGNNTGEARELGARRLLRANSDEATRLLVEVLASSGDLAARQAVCRAMGNGESPAVALIEPLIQLLGGENGALDNDIVAALRAFDRGSVLKKLKSIAGNGALLIERRRAAIGAIGRLGEDFHVITALAGLLSDEDERVCLAAMNAMQTVAGVTFVDLQSVREWWAGRADMSAEEWLSEINQRRALENQRLAAERDILAARLLSFARELYHRTPIAEQPDQLLKFLRDDQAPLRSLGLDLVNAQITDGKEIRQDIRSYLIEMLIDSDSDIRRRAAIMAGDLRIARSVLRLRESIQVEPDARVRAAQVAALGRLDDPTAIPTLLERLDDSAPIVVGEAAMALGVLARPNAADADTVRRIADALLARLESIPQSDPWLREQFIEAMGRIGSPQFRRFLKQEMLTGSTVGVRRAAALAMSIYADVTAAEDVRPLLETDESELRMAAVAVLARCGRSAVDLAALGARLDSRREQDASVRRKAWDAYLEIAARMPPLDQLNHAADFALVGDQPASRRRVALLRGLKNRTDIYEQLGAADRLRLLDAMSTALSEQNEAAAEIKCLEEAVLLSRSSGAGRAEELVGRLVEASIRYGMYEALIAQLQTGEAPEISRHRDELLMAVLDCLRRRTEQAREAGEFAAVLAAAERIAPQLSATETQRRADLDQVRRLAVQRRDAVIAELLDELLTSPEAETRLAAFGRELVLPGLRGVLAGDGAARPAPDVERRLIECARRLSPGWNGYPPDATSEQKAAALAELTRAPGDATSRPASASG